MSSEPQFKKAFPYQKDVLALPVKDLDAASQWYCSHFGMVEVERRQQPVPTVVLERDGTRIDLATTSTEEIVDLGIALVPEGRRLFPRLTVEENLLLGAYRPGARADIDRNLPFCFEAFPVLRERRRQLAGSMSGGEQQMLAVARALMSSPRILLVDEPSVGLAPILVSRVIAKIRELKERYQLTVLMAEQNFNQATKIADRGYIIVHGRIEFEGRSTQELRENELVKKYYLGV